MLAIAASALHVGLQVVEPMDGFAILLVDKEVFLEIAGKPY